VAYGSESVALAPLEVLAHLSTTTVLGSYSLASTRFPEELVVSLDAASLPHRDFARMVVDAPEPYVWDPRVLRS
jgi:hypothetical protein